MPGGILLAFCGMICGLFTTPVHLCLALSVSYFEAPFGKILRELLAPAILVAATGVAMAILFR